MLKNKLVKILSLISMLCTLIFGVTACNQGGGDGGDEATYKIEFIVDGDVYHEVKLDGSEITMPKAPSKEGFVFDGWVIAENSSEEFDFASVELKDYRVYAKWKPASEGEHTHNFNIEVNIAPTCKEKGYTALACSCGELSNYVELEPAHEYKIIENIEAGCGKEGYSRYRCNVCDDEYEEISPALEHLYQETNRYDATCTTGETVEYECKFCQDKYQTVGEPNAHNFITYVYNNDATVDSDGTETAKCNNPGCKEENTRTATGTRLAPSLTFKMIEVDADNNGYIVVPYEQTTFDFNEEVVLNAGVLRVGVGLAGMNEISSVAPVDVGENRYVVSASYNGTTFARYFITVKRLGKFNVSFNTNGGSAIAGQIIDENELATQPSVAPTKQGYTFVGYDFDFSTPIVRDITVNAIWAPNGDTPYTVEYYFETLESGEYEINQAETQALTGETDATVTITAKAFAHYDPVETAVSAVISASGDTVISLYYNRKIYAVTTKSDDFTAVTDGGEYVYGQSVTLSATASLGYNLLGFFVGGSSVSNSNEYTFVVDGDVEVEVKSIARNDIFYKVEHYFEKLAGGNEKQEFTFENGTTGEEITVSALTVENYETTTETASAVINADGSTVIRFYYTLKRYAVTVNSENKKATLSGGGEYAYGSTATVTTQALEGYDFTGWLIGGKNVGNNLTHTFTVSGDTTVSAVFTARSDTKYTLNYYFEQLSGEFEKVVKELKGTTDAFAYYDPEAVEGYVTPSSIGIMVYPDGSAYDDVYYYLKTYYVAFEANGGTLVSGNRYYENVKHGSAVEPPIFERTGYTFAGFDKDVNSITSEDRIYAQWTPNSFAVSYVTGVDGVTLPSDVAIYDQPYVTAKAPERPGYLFVKWVDQDGNRYNAGDRYKNNEISKDVTLTAEWLALYEIEDGIITDYLGDHCASIVIPDAVDGEKITGIGERAFESFSVYEITIPEGIKTIGRYAFINLLRSTTIYFNATDCEVLDATQTYGPFKSTNISPSSPKNITFIFGKNVTRIPSYLLSGCETKTVEFEEGSICSEIGDYALNAHYMLIDLELPSTVKKLGTYAIKARYSELTIGSNITELGNCAFGNSDVETVYFNSTVKNAHNVLGPEPRAVDFTYPSVNFIIGANVKEIPSNLFYGSKRKVNLTFENSSNVTAIGDYAFCQCQNLTFDMPSSVTSVGSWAFTYYTAPEFTIGKNLTTIGEKAFNRLQIETLYYENEALTDVAKDVVVFSNSNAFKLVIKSNVTKIPANLFSGLIFQNSSNCYFSVSEIEFEAGSKLNTIGAGAFENNDKLISVVLPNSVERIEVDAFGENENLLSVKLGTNLQYVDEDAFRNSFRLSEIINNSSIEVVNYFAVSIKNGDYASQIYYDEFGNAYLNDGSDIYLLQVEKSLTELNVPNGVTKIKKYAAKGYGNLTTVILPDSTVEIGEYAFYTGAIKTVTLGKNIESIKYSAFGNTVKTVYYGGSANDWLNVLVSGSHVIYTSTQFYANGELVTSLNINTEHVSNSYSMYTYLESVVLGENVKSLAESAFHSCSGLKSVSGLEKLTVIPLGAFAMCTNLNITVDLSSATEIGQEAFRGAGITGVITSSALTKINNNAFYSCNNLKSFVVEENVTFIGYRAFSQSAIETVEFKNSANWYRYTNASTTSGTAIDESVIISPSTVADWLKNSYSNFYWKRTA